MRRSFVFAALVLPALAGTQALAQTTPPPAPAMSAPDSAMPSDMDMGKKAPHRQHHHKRTMTPSADAQGQPTGRHHRRSMSSNAEQDQTRQLNQQQMNGGGASMQPAPAQAMPAPSSDMPATDGE